MNLSSQLLYCIHRIFRVFFSLLVCILIDILFSIYIVLSAIIAIILVEEAIISLVIVIYIVF